MPLRISENLEEEKADQSYGALDHRKKRILKEDIQKIKSSKDVALGGLLEDPSFEQSSK